MIWELFLISMLICEYGVLNICRYLLNTILQSIGRPQVLLDKSDDKTTSFGIIYIVFAIVFIIKQPLVFFIDPLSNTVMFYNMGFVDFYFLYIFYNIYHIISILSLILGVKTFKFISNNKKIEYYISYIYNLYIDKHL